MLRFRVATSIVIFSVLGVSSLPFTLESGCSPEASLLGLCGSTDGSSLTVSGTQQQPGTNSNSQNGDGEPDASPGPFRPGDDADDLAACEAGPNPCPPRLNTPSSPSGPLAPGIPTFTISDLAQFAPASVPAVSEPGNLGIVGMPTNFLGATSVQTQTGELFGISFRVRFSPAAYDYTYGDGTSATLTTPGQTWAALGQAQFTPTATSHIYRAPGTYLAEVDVRYSAEIDLGGGWMPVDGHLSTDGPDQEIRILEAHTALVAHTCKENPAGIGC